MLKQLSMGALTALVLQVSNAASIQLVYNTIADPDGAEVPVTSEDTTFATVTIADIAPSDFSPMFQGIGDVYGGIRYTVELGNDLVGKGVRDINMPNIGGTSGMYQLFVDSSDAGIGINGNMFASGNDVYMTFTNPDFAFTGGDTLIFDLYNDGGKSVSDIEFESSDYTITANNIDNIDANGTQGWIGLPATYSVTSTIEDDGIIDIDLGTQPGDAPSGGPNLPEPNTILFAAIPFLALVMRRKRTNN